MKKYSVVIAIFSTLFIISLLLVLCTNINGNIDLIESDTIYKTDESGTVSSVEITVTNKSLKNFDNLKLVLTYCKQDGYPEGYTSPIIISMNGLENKKFEIDNFRNTWHYNDNYHIQIDLSESDKEFNSKSIKSSKAEYVFSYIGTILAPISFSGIVIFGILAAVENSKNKKKK